ncbi:MAG: AI-2E family transporter [bacterium]|nr:AI-2E family transporter [bacterium]
MENKTVKLSARFYRICSYVGIVLLIIFACYLLNCVKMVAGMLFVSIFAAYLLAPGVDFFCRKHINRILAIVIVYLIVAALIGFFLTYLVPVVSHEFHRLTQNLSNLAANIETIIYNMITAIQNRLPASLKPMVDPEKIKINDILNYFQNDAASIMGGGLSGVFSGMKSAAGVITGMFLVPLLTFYILMDINLCKHSFISFIPRSYRKTAAELMFRVNKALGGYIRGQLIVCISIGIFVGTALSILGLDYAVLIGVFAGIVDIIPYVGVLLGLIPAFIIALINKGIWFALFTIAILECIHWLEGHVVVPAVVGHSVGLPPLVVTVALLVGAEAGGVMGMFMAVPMAAIIRVLAEFIVEKHSSFGKITDEEMKELDSVIAEGVKSPLGTELLAGEKRAEHAVQSPNSEIHADENTSKESADVSAVSETSEEAAAPADKTAADEAASPADSK